MADATCTLNPKHNRRKLETPKEVRQGFCSDCAAQIERQDQVREKNRRAVPRQKAKDAFMADHPELFSANGVWLGESQWLDYAGEN